MARWNELGVDPSAAALAVKEPNGNGHAVADALAAALPPLHRGALPKKHGLGLLQGFGGVGHSFGELGMLG